MRISKLDLIANEIIKWEDRVWVNEEPDRNDDFHDLSFEYSIRDRIKNKIKNVKINEKLDEYFSNNNFSILKFNNSNDIYKFLRYGIERNFINNTNITFFRTSLLEPYLDLSLSHDQKIRSIDMLIGHIESQNINGSYVAIPDFDIQFDKKIASYFINKLITCGCAGIVSNFNTNINTLDVNAEKFKICKINTVEF